MTTKEMMVYDQIVELEIATAEEINLVKCIRGGSWMEVLNDIISVRTGYSDFDDFIEAEMSEE